MAEGKGGAFYHPLAAFARQKNEFRTFEGAYEIRPRQESLGWDGVSPPHGKSLLAECREIFRHLSRRPQPDEFRRVDIGMFPSRKNFRHGTWWHYPAIFGVVAFEGPD